LAQSEVIMTPRSKNRLILVAVLLLFAAPMLIAFLLNAEGWHPQKTRNTGVLIEPSRDVVSVPLKLSDGNDMVWRNPQWQWTLLALPGAKCESVCRERLDEILRMRLTLGRNAERLRVVYLGPEMQPDFVTARAPLVTARDDTGFFSEYRAHGDDAMALALVDPNGRLMMRYAEGYPALGVRDDIMRVFH
jgi:hypothetical protein